MRICVRACVSVAHCDARLKATGPYPVVERRNFRKWDVGAWTGSFWLRIGTGGGHL